MEELQREVEEARLRAQNAEGHNYELQARTHVVHGAHTLRMPCLSMGDFRGRGMARRFSDLIMSHLDRLRKLINSTM